MKEEQAFYYVHILSCKDDRYYETQEEAEKRLKQLLTQIYGSVPKYHDGMDVMHEYLDKSNLLDMRDAPFGMGGNYYMKY